MTDHVATVTSQIIPRMHFQPGEPKDKPVPLDPASTTYTSNISALHMHKRALEDFQTWYRQHPSPLEVLDAGCGSGYMVLAFAVLLAELGSTGSTVVGVDAFAEAVVLSRKNIRNVTLKDGYTVQENYSGTYLLKKEEKEAEPVATMRVEDAQGVRKQHLTADKKYDVIHLGYQVSPEAWQELAGHLNTGGLLMGPKKTQWCVLSADSKKTQSGAKWCVLSADSETCPVGVNYEKSVETET